jgi:hypothetical protein
MTCGSCKICNIRGVPPGSTYFASGCKDAAKVPDCQQECGWPKRRPVAM